MAHDPHHEHLIKEITEMMEPVYKKSPQAIYIYLDDEHKSCNEKFAKMLGYKSAKEWVDNPYPVEDIAPEDQDKGIKAYMDASKKLISTTIHASWVKKDGKKIKTITTMVPFSYQGEVFVIHYISPEK